MTVTPQARLNALQDIVGIVNKKLDKLFMLWKTVSNITEPTFSDGFRDESTLINSLKST